MDFGLVVLIWMVQRIVYPSFLHYSADRLVTWHSTYMIRLSYIVIPLMLGQLGISIYQVTVLTDLYTLMNLTLIVLLWLFTFVRFVPIHTAIAKGRAGQKMLKALVTENWIRTVLWTLVFLCNGFRYV